MGLSMKLVVVNGMNYSSLLLLNVCSNHQNHHALLESPMFPTRSSLSNGENQPSMVVVWLLNINFTNVIRKTLNGFNSKLWTTFNSVISKSLMFLNAKNVNSK